MKELTAKEQYSLNIENKIHKIKGQLYCLKELKKKIEDRISVLYSHRELCQKAIHELHFYKLINSNEISYHQQMERKLYDNINNLLKSLNDLERLIEFLEYRLKNKLHEECNFYHFLKECRNENE